MTKHFFIAYDVIGAGLTIDDYAAALETSWTAEVDRFGWAAPPVYTPKPAPKDRYPVRLDLLAPHLQGLTSSKGTHAGQVGDNPNTAWTEPDAQATCIVLDSDLSGESVAAQQLVELTAAHEFNHALQFGYGALTGANKPDASFIEGGATWMSGEVVDSADTMRLFPSWPRFDRSMGDYGFFPYFYWVTFRGLTERFGSGIPGGAEQVMQDFWESTSQSATSNQLVAMDDALKNRGTNLADAFHAYAIAVMFERTCRGGYAYPYCFEEAASYAATAGIVPPTGILSSDPLDPYRGSIEDDYAINFIQLPTYPVQSFFSLENVDVGGLIRGSIVCDTGSGLKITPMPAVAGAQTATGVVFDQTPCSGPATMVITNEFQSAPNPTGEGLRTYVVSRQDCNGLMPTIIGTSNDDVLTGTAGDDVIVGMDGDDVINGLGGNDTICGGNDRDIVDGGAGVDTMFGGEGPDSLRGGPDIDLLFGEEGADRLFGDEANPAANDGNDVVFGGTGNDSVYGGGGNDTLYGGDGNDTVLGESGDDYVYGCW